MTDLSITINDLDLIEAIMDYAEARGQTPDQMIMELLRTELLAAEFEVYQGGKQ